MTDECFIRSFGKPQGFDTFDTLDDGCSYRSNSKVNANLQS